MKILQIKQDKGNPFDPSSLEIKHGNEDEDFYNPTLYEDVQEGEESFS